VCCSRLVSIARAANLGTSNRAPKAPPACAAPPQDATPAPHPYPIPSPQTTHRTLNTNHAGLAVAVSKGFFSDAGLAVDLLSPHADGYKTTPASQLATGAAQLACVPSESVVSWATWPGEGRPKIVAVATLLQVRAGGVCCVDRV
jgi:ABC-type nitrate/sulfonate/bicarbonate transport system substrate-binding protein